MNKLPQRLVVYLSVVFILFITAVAARAQMVVESLGGSVTANELSTFKTYVQGLSFPTTQSYNNEWAVGTTGRAMEAMGMMYEVSRDSAILNRMIQFSEGALALRNDLTDKRVMWTGNVEPVWLTKTSTDAAAGYSGCESGEILGHIAYCARLILQTPSLWNTTCPVGNTKYGTTYLQKANNYITNCEYSMDQYFNVWFPDSTTHRIKNSTQLPTAWQNLGQSADAWNRQFMFLNAWQRLDECHLLLNDNPAKETLYSQIVTAAQQYMISQVTTTTVSGQPCYTWTYGTGQAGGSEELNQHAEYDMWGMSRIYVSGRYGLSQTTMWPFSEDLRYVIYQGNNTFAEWVNGTTSTTRTYIYPGWMGISANDPCVYTIMATPDSASSHVASGADYDSQILWTKNARYLGIFPNNCDAADFSLTSSWFEKVSTSSNSTYSVTVNPLAGFGSGVTLTMTGLPTGVTASFSAGYNSTLTLAASGSAVSGTYLVNISGTGGGITRIVPVTLVVTNSGTADFSISTTPSSQNTTIGGNTTYTATVSALNGFSGSVALSVSGLPSGASGSFSPASISGSGSSTLTVTTTTNTASGNYTLTIKGTSGSLVHSNTVTLVLADFTLSATPASQTVIVGSATNYTVNVGNVNGFGGTVTFSVSGLPTGATANFVPTSVTTIGSSTLTVTTTGTTPVGTNTLTITGTSGSLQHGATVTLIVLPVPDFSISTTPASQTVTAGNGTNYTSTVTALNGFSGSVALTVSGLPSGASGSFNPTSISGSGSSTLTITTTAGTTVGTSTLTIKGTSGSLIHSNTVSLTVNAPPQVAAPTFSPGAGTYTSAQTVTISTTTGGATIRYTTDGSTPSETAGTVYSGTVTVSSSLTLKAIAYENGYTDSTVSSAAYTINLPQAATPTFSPGAGTYSSAQTVTISTTTGGATIRYTTDGSTPSETAGTVYSGTVTVSTNTTLKAIAYESGYIDSTVSSAAYTINLPQAATPTFSPGAGTYSSAQTVTISTTTGGATIRYTTDGSTPSETAGTVYSSPVAVSSSLTLKAIAYESGYTDSAVASAAYVINGGTGGTTNAVNDTDSGITYTGTWSYSATRGYGDYQDDVHYSKTNGNSFSYTFTGTGVDYVTEKYNNEGNVDIYIDGTLQTTVNCSNATRLAQQVVYSARGLSSGSHTIKGVKDNGTYLLLDELIVYAPAVPNAAAPTFSPGAGTYTSVQAVTISTTTGGATIRYTTDGSTPSETVGTVYSSPVTVASNLTLNAIAYESGYNDSSVSSAAYTINLPQAATPTFSPGAGTYTNAQTVTIGTTTGGATIRYTTDGSTPSETAGTVYSSPVAVASSLTLKAIAYENGYNDSAVGSAAYTINIPSGSTNNLALNQPATASTTWSSSYTAAMAVDGNTSTRWSAASGQTNNQWLMVDLGSMTNVDRVVIMEISFQRVTSFQIQVSSDGTNFTQVASGTTIGSSLNVPFSTVSTRYVRLYVNTASNVPTINEFQVYAN